MSSKIQLSFQKLDKAMKALEKAINKPMDPDGMMMDVVIHRFEFTFELYWKLLKRILESQGIEAAFPKQVLQEAFAGKLIDDEIIWLGMLHDRNQTSHTYNEEVAKEIYTNIKRYFPEMKKTFDFLGNHLSPN